MTSFILNRSIGKGTALPRGAGSNASVAGQASTPPPRSPQRLIDNRQGRVPSHATLTSLRVERSGLGGGACVFVSALDAQRPQAIPLSE